MINSLFKKFLVVFVILISSNAISKYKFGLEKASEEFVNQASKIEKYRSFLPESVDLSPLMPPVADQGETNSCLSWAANYYVKSYIEYRFLGGQDFYSPSFMYDYYANGNCERPLNWQEAMDFMTNNGSLPVSMYDINYENCSLSQNSSSLLNSAKNFKVKEFYFGKNEKNSSTLDSIKGILYLEYPVIVGMNMTEDFFEYSGGIYKKIIKPGEEEDIGHAMVVVGYDDKKSAFKIINSWSEDWGEKGFVWYDYDAFLNNHDITAFFEVAGHSIMDPETSSQPETNVNLLENDEKVNAEFNENAINSLIDNINRSNPCTLLSGSIDSNSLKLEGLTIDQSRKNQIIEDIQSSYPAISINENIFVRPWPSCELIITSIFFDESKTEISTDKETYKDGDILNISFDPKKENGYLNLFYLQANGTAVEILNDYKVSANKSVNINNILKDFNLKISAPYGEEALIAFLFNDPDLLDFTNIELLDREFLTIMRTKSFEYKQNGKLKDLSVTFIGTEK